MEFWEGEVVNSPIDGITAIAPPFEKAAVFETPKRATKHGITIIKIAPANNLLFPFF